MPTIVELMVTSKGDSLVGIQPYQEKITVLYHYSDEIDEEELEELKNFFAEMHEGSCVTYYEWLENRESEMVKEAIECHEEKKKVDVKEAADLQEKSKKEIIRVRIEGGTHLNVVGCYGERIFELPVMDTPCISQSIADILRKDLPILKRKSCITCISPGETTTYRFVDDNDLTIFEFLIKDVQ